MIKVYFGYMILMILLPRAKCKNCSESYWSSWEPCHPKDQCFKKKTLLCPAGRGLQCVFKDRIDFEQIASVGCSDDCLSTGLLSRRLVRVVVVAISVVLFT